MEKIIDRLYVGNRLSVEPADKKGYSILAACKDGSEDCHRAVLGYETLGAPKDKDYYFVRKDKDHLALNLIDVPDVNLIPKEVIDAGLRFMRERYDAGKTVLVHCVAGHSRSPVMMLMFLRTIGEMPSGFLTSERKFRTLYHEYDPGEGMRKYAKKNWGDLENFK